MIQIPKRSSLLTYKRGLSLLRPKCYALVSPKHVVLDVGGKSRPFVYPFESMPEAMADQFEVAMAKLLHLTDAAGVRGRQLSVVVSDAWARPAVLTLPDKAATDETVDKVLAEHYRKTYGDLMDGWRMCWDRLDKQLVGVAWPEAGLATLNVGLMQRDCFLASAQPLGLEVVNSLSNVPNSGWVLILARPYVTMLLMQEGGLVDWWVFAEGNDLTASLILRLSRESARRSAVGKTVVIIDFHDESNVASSTQALLDAGWLPQIAEVKHLGGSVAFRLHSLITRHKTT
jgi:hypothetical protein